MHRDRPDFGQHQQKPMQSASAVLAVPPRSTHLPRMCHAELWLLRQADQSSFAFLSRAFRLNGPNDLVVPRVIVGFCKLLAERRKVLERVDGEASSQDEDALIPQSFHRLTDTVLALRVQTGILRNFNDRNGERSILAVRKHELEGNEDAVIESGRMLGPVLRSSISTSVLRNGTQSGWQSGLSEFTDDTLAELTTTTATVGQIVKRLRKTIVL